MAAHYDDLVARLLADGDVAAAVTAFTTPVAAAGPEEREALLWTAWDSVIIAAGDTGDAGRQRLVALVAGVKELGPPTLGAAMREWWNPDARSPDWWAGLNAFAARLTPDVHDFRLFGLWTIREALETADGAAAYLPAAVQWFQHCGAELAATSATGLDYGRPGRPGDLARRAGLTENGFSRRRWRFWRDRMKTLGRDDI